MARPRRVAQRLANSRVESRAGVLHRHVLPVIEDVALREVKPSQAVDVLGGMDRAGLGQRQRGCWDGSTPAL